MNASRPLSTPLALLIVVVATLLTFAPVARFEFTTWDDPQTVARNPLLTPPTVRSLKTFWTTAQGHLYVPVTYTVWALAAKAALGPSQQPGAPPTLDPRVFHALNLALHAAAACVVFLLLRLLIPTDSTLPALLGALLFALHPVQVEPVAWVSGTKDLLCGLFSLLALWQYLKLVRDHARGRALPPAQWWGRYVPATVLVALAMLSKPTAMVVPAVVMLLATLVLGRPWREAMKHMAAWFALSLVCAITALQSQPAHHVAPLGVAPGLRPLVAGDALAFYLYKLVVPATLTFDYGRTPARVLAHGWIWWTWLAPAGVAIVAWKSRARAPAILAGLGAFVIVLLPVLGLVPFDFQAYSTVADHYLYLAMFGPALAAGWLVSRRPAKHVIAVATVVIILLGARSFAQTRHWRDSVTLLAHGRQANPNSFASYQSLAALAIDAGRPDVALDLARRAIEINPNWAGSYLTYAEAARHTGRTDEAIGALRKSLELDPDRSEALSNLAAMLASRGEIEQALPVAERAVKAAPDSVSARMNLGKMYLQQGRRDAARTEFEAVLRLNPSHAEARELLGQLSASP